ncbi:MAG: hypothetical protein LC790_15980, partial [Actinobacteria bacterium]|nr:hypothetical protein [Actinomycetota bacterium]
MSRDPLHGRTKLPQHAGCLTMGSSYRVSADVRSDRVAYQSVGETQPLARREQVRQNQCVGGSRRALQGKIGQLGGDRKLCAVTKDGDSPSQRGCFARKPRQTAQDRR